MRGRGLGAAGLALAAAVLGTAPAQAEGGTSPYVFADGAARVAGEVSSTDAHTLAAGRPYRSQIGPGEELYYAVDLDATSYAYASAVAVPKPGAKVGTRDRLTVTLRDRRDNQCGTGDTRFGSAAYPRPLAAQAVRAVKPDGGTCQEAGPYFLVVERETGGTSAQEPWELELRLLTEPAVQGKGGPTEAPSPSPTDAPADVPGGEPVARRGGTGFNDAVALGDGSFKTRLKPGGTTFYRVPVDWGQRLYVEPELGSATTDKSMAYVSSALETALYNPAFGPVDDGSLLFNGSPQTLASEPLQPVAYENRHASAPSVKGTRFAGWYYVQLTLSPKMAEVFRGDDFGVTLRVRVQGEPVAGPRYAGDAGPFQVGDREREAAEAGRSDAEVARGETMAVVAASGIGAGTVLLVGLGVWFWVPRRGAAGSRVRSG
ncbi:hypothetical protein [Streptomyces albidoflavus]|uniref:hypothetical protein n=1 Tax=Streptomyces albidoflavus TaxID=1886 RepID=UPI00101E99CA|nr:hypothetical protein [Streptomyces albidoflavus]RZE79011.1 hypothetical protein C0R02_15295 [Streptomyces albidoflavus]CAI4166820.1 hypothetical protein CCOS2040_15095 [Streptomyces albidoflavus]